MKSVLAIVHCIMVTTKATVRITVRDIEKNLSSENDDPYLSFRVVQLEARSPRLHRNLP